MRENRCTSPPKTPILALTQHVPNRFMVGRTATKKKVTLLWGTIDALAFERPSCVRRAVTPQAWGPSIVRLRPIRQGSERLRPRSAASKRVALPSRATLPDRSRSAALQFVKELPILIINYRGFALAGKVRQDRGRSHALPACGDP